MKQLKLEGQDRHWIDIDFEFYGTAEYRPNIVCCSIWDSETDETLEFWTHDDDDIKEDLRNYISARKDTHTFRAYMAIAEVRSFLAIDIEDAKEYEWVDLYLEWRQLTNHNDRMAYGDQLIDGREVKTFPLGKWEKKKKYRNYSKCQHGLAASTYKLLGIKIDTDHKTEMRDIIISANKEAIEENRDDIQAYCTSDIVYMREMYPAMLREYRRLLSKKDFALLHGEMLYRGNYSARTAYIEREGEPINVEWAKNFADSVPQIIRDLQQEINSLFPDIKPFRFKRVDGSYSWNQIATREWIKTLDKTIVDQWLLTDTGSLSLKLEAFTKFFSYRHTYPKDCFGGQIVRYLRLKQSLNGFLPAKKGKRNFFDSIGEDGRARPFLGIYGSQSGRNQPSATGFLFLKAAWSRALSEPPEGYICADIDYASQEFLGGALEAGDMEMIKAYHSGDPYLYFAKAAGAVPPEGTKATHSAERNLFKSTVLGIGYGMKAKNLAIKLTNDTGTYHDEEAAQRMVDLFEGIFSVYAEYRNHGIIDKYDTDLYIKLRDGWVLFGDNPNNLSVSNFPTQGQGSVILRKMVATLQDEGLRVIRTLHDAGYIEVKFGEWDKLDTFWEGMAEAFYRSYDGHPLQEYAKIRLDGEVWGRDIVKRKDDAIVDKGDGHFELTTPKGVKFSAQEIYIDGRAIDDYNRFSEYFMTTVEERLGGL